VATPACATRTVTALDVHPTGTDFGYRDTTPRPQASAISSGRI
jgi:hypothetical protein